MSLTYTTYVAAMEQLLVVTDANGQSLFNAVLPDMIDYAELRIYRELDFLSTVTTYAAALTGGSRNFAIPAGTFVVIQSANLITPASTAPDSGTRNPMRRVSKEFLDAAYPSQAVVATPQVPAYYAMLTDTQMLVGPSPDATYQAELTGTMRPAPISNSNPTTFISTYLPDLFIAASMVFGTGYQRNFGAQSDDPRMAVSWEQQYQTLKQGAEVEELRKKAQGPAWQPYSPTPLAQPPRA